MAENLKGELRDQTAHIVAAVIILAPILAWPSVASFAWAGFCAGAVREITELGNPVTPAKVWHSVKTSKLDLMFWTIGGALSALIFGDF